MTHVLMDVFIVMQSKIETSLYIVSKSITPRVNFYFLHRNMSLKSTKR
jgi:hypothetical protein